MIGRRETLWSGLRGAVAGAVVGWLPGFSSGTANALLAIRRDGDFEKTDPREYLIATSAANTANAVLGIAALYAIGRMRSGAMVALASLELPPLSLLVLVAAVAALLAYGITIGVSRSASLLMRINQRSLAKSTCVFGCGIVCVLRTIRSDDSGSRYAGRTGSWAVGCAQDFLHGGNYGTGNVVYAGCAPVLSLPENTDFAFCFFELFENLFSGIALI